MKSEKEKIIDAYDYMNNLMFEQEEKVEYTWLGNGLPDGYDPKIYIGSTNEDDFLINSKDYAEIKNTFENICKNYDISYDFDKIDIIEDTKENLAQSIDDFMLAYDTYEYHDRVDTREEGYNEALSLLNENPKEILNTLERIKENAKQYNDDETIRDANRLINKINNTCKLNSETELDKRLKEKEERLKDEEPKIHNKKDFEKLSEFANKLTKENLNELQNILIQCEYDTNVLSDFTSAVDKVSVNKNMTEDQIHINTILVYDTKENALYDMSIIDKQENAKFSFEKYVDFLEEHKANNLVMIQAKEPSFNSFDNKESNIIRVLFDVSKTNGNKLMDFVAVSVDTIKKNGMGEFNTKSLISNKCYSYKFKTSENFKNHISKLEINEQMKAKQGLYANTEVKTESNSYKAPK